MLGLAIVLVAGQVRAESFEVADSELARLGIELAAAEATDRVAVAAAPAEVVVPAGREAVVGAPADGLVVRLLAAVGEPVHRGQPIAELDSAELLDWQSEYLEASAQRELAASQLARDRDLRADGVIPERRLEETTVRAHAAELAVGRAAERLRVAGFDSQALAALGAKRELSARLVLRAPFDGVVAAAHTKIGARVGALDAIVTVADLGTLWLELHVRQEDAAKIAPGMVAAVGVGSAIVEAPITVVGRVVEPETQTVLVRAVADNVGGTLRAGQFLAARVLASAASGAFVVPTRAVTRSGDAAYVFVREPGGFAARRVEVLAEDSERVFVGGIDRGGQRVAVGGVAALKSLWLSAREGGG
jgi:RND family efflux transporter MFP subunit